MKTRGQQRSSQGFTIVELLIVVVVIAILAAIIIVAYNGIQNRAKSAVIASSLNSIEKALILAARTEQIDTWWYDDDYKADDGESYLQILIDETSLGDYMDSPPRVVGEDSSFWEWDNDGNEGDDTGYDPTVCPIPSGTLSDGVNIKMQLTQATALEVDKTIDDGNINCGKFRLDPNDEVDVGQIYLYLISETDEVIL